jgi:hypothetical protein
MYSDHHILIIIIISFAIVVSKLFHKYMFDEDVIDYTFITF